MQVSFPIFSSIRWKSLLSAGAILCLTGPAPSGAASESLPDATKITFTADDGAHPNPERGFYRSATVPLQELGIEEAQAAFAQGYRLIYVRVDLSAYRDAPLPDSFLRKIGQGFANARRGGIKLIVRPIYNYPAGETDYAKAQDASFQRVLDHIAQLQGVFAENEDVIAFLQAGYVGAWGEWHTSSNDLASPAHRAALMKALLAAAPHGQAVQFRYPAYITEFLAAEGGLGAALAKGIRIGFHNDCFLASDTDVGTYSEDPAEREKARRAMADLGRAGPFGGETCNPLAAENPTPRSSCEAIVREGAMFGLTYLNDGYYRPLFHDRWQAGGCLDTVRASMGYRISLTGLAFARTARRNSVMPLTLSLRNSGWAPLYAAKRLSIILQNRKTGKTREYGAPRGDVRTWLPGSSKEVALQLPIEADLPAGEYEILLALRDGSERLAKDPRYSIRFANADDAAKGQQWQDRQAAWKTGAIVEITE
ncbi:DUF4832 domain-containing protein [Sphingobium amiense]|uniref:DUF4832 domain-containing protein n=1 Tax=Sphingobium amiense TaxID=135719 RepID=A0A494VWF8_9SPHN|nr:DUF4832 domain-containing protein [Sphingobium amiense]BBD96744.1 DUF4832 domain-containing protein [Sphingobium amiense]